MPGAPALSDGLVGGGGQVCKQIDAVLCAENYTGGMPRCFGSTEEGISPGVGRGNG